MDDEQGFIDPIKDTQGAWVEQLPEDIREDAQAFVTNKNIEDFPGVMKSILGAQKLIGANKVVVPGEAATEEELNNFYTALGRPETPNDYGVKPLDEMPNGFPYKEELANEFAGEAHKLGLTTKQTQGLFNWFLSMEVDAFNGINKDREEEKQNAELALRKEFGKAYDDKLKAAQTLIRKYADDDVFKHLEDTGFGNDPKVVKLIARIAQEFSEDRLKGDGSGVYGAMSPQEAQSKIQELQADKEFSDAYMNKKNPGHTGAVERMAALYRLAYPEEK